MNEIAGSYKQSSIFCDLMLEYMSKGIIYNDALDDARYSELEKQTDILRNQNSKFNGAGGLIYWLLHPVRMTFAQKYYSSGFGKP